MATIGDTIRDLRRIRGLTQQQLAALVGVSRAALASWETGRRTPDVQTIRALASAFGTTTDYLLGHREFNGVVREAEPASGCTSRCSAAHPLDPELLQDEERELWHQLELHFRRQKKLTNGQIKAILAILKIDDE